MNWFQRGLCGLASIAVLLFPAMGLEGCSNPISGSAPQFLAISTSGQVTNAGTTRIFECLNGSVAAVMYFTNGQLGNFTSRVHWTSSNTGTVLVSNNDIPNPATPGVNFPAGTLIGVTAGTAIVTAQYFTIQQQIVVSVGVPENFAIKTIVQGDYTTPRDINGNPVNASTIGVNTNEDLAVTAILDGVEVDISKFATWSFQNPDPSVATIVPNTAAVLGTGARVTALEAGGPLMAQATFYSCPLLTANGNNLVHAVTVNTIQSIAIEPEFTTQPQLSADGKDIQLIAGTAEKINVFAYFDASPHQIKPQDISLQTSLTSSNPSILSFTGTFGFNFSGGNNLLVASGAGGPSVIQAKFTSQGNLIQANSLQGSVIPATLQAIVVCAPPQDLVPDLSQPNSTECPALPYTVNANTVCQGSKPDSPPNTVTSIAGSLCPVQYHAVGIYDDGSLVQDITRIVKWSSNDTTIGAISNSTQTAGQVLTDTPNSGSITLTAQDTGAAAVTTQSAQLVTNPR